MYALYGLLDGFRWSSQVAPFGAHCSSPNKKWHRHGWLWTSSPTLGMSTINSIAMAAACSLKRSGGILLFLRLDITKPHYYGTSTYFLHELQIGREKRLNTSKCSYLTVIIAVGAFPSLWIKWFNFPDIFLKAERINWNRGLASNVYMLHKVTLIKV